MKEKNKMELSRNKHSTLETQLEFTFIKSLRNDHRRKLTIVSNNNSLIAFLLFLR